MCIRDRYMGNSEEDDKMRALSRYFIVSLVFLATNLISCSGQVNANAEKVVNYLKKQNFGSNLYGTTLLAMAEAYTPWDTKLFKDKLDEALDQITNHLESDKDLIETRETKKTKILRDYWKRSNDTNAKIMNIRGRIAKITGEINEIENKIDQLEADIDEGKMNIDEDVHNEVVNEDDGKDRGGLLNTIVTDIDSAIAKLEDLIGEPEISGGQIMEIRRSVKRVETNVIAAEIGNGAVPNIKAITTLCTRIKFDDAQDIRTVIEMINDIRSSAVRDLEEVQQSVEKVDQIIEKEIVNEAEENQNLEFEVDKQLVEITKRQDLLEQYNEQLTALEKEMEKIQKGIELEEVYWARQIGYDKTLLEEMEEEEELLRKLYGYLQKTRRERAFQCLLHDSCIRTPCSSTPNLFAPVLQLRMKDPKLSLIHI
eukprot:TRINITY_DN5005_c0_g1_i1.p1 TRINITY_DN5005_c0_g1~~TRINITY_DN5005_c0_g1_i1.p1  ORF type:complete len:446 (-),score=123.34 TRINITY_DN5005_c0_g1_i1:2-1279(-)